MWILALLIIAAIYAAAGTVLWLGLAMFDVGITFWQAFVLAIMISVVGGLFNGVKTKGDA